MEFLTIILLALMTILMTMVTMSNNGKKVQETKAVTRKDIIKRTQTTIRSEKSIDDTSIPLPTLFITLDEAYDNKLKNEIVNKPIVEELELYESSISTNNYNSASIVNEPSNNVEELIMETVPSIPKDTLIDRRSISKYKLEPEELVYTVEDNILLIKHITELIKKGSNDALIKLLNYHSQFGDLSEIYEHLHIDNYLFREVRNMAY